MRNILCLICLFAASLCSAAEGGWVRKPEAGYVVTENLDERIMSVYTRSLFPGTLRELPSCYLTESRSTTTLTVVHYYDHYEVALFVVHTINKTSLDLGPSSAVLRGEDIREKYDWVNPTLEHECWTALSSLPDSPLRDIMMKFLKKNDISVQGERAAYWASRG